MHKVSEIPALRTQPAYSILEASRYLMIPVATLRSWSQSEISASQAAKRITLPLILLPSATAQRLSFINLVEAHVLRIIRASHRISLSKVRLTLDYVNHQFGVPHPLAHVEFQTDGVDLFVESIGRLINTSKSGQLALRETFQRLLERVEVDESGVAARLYPLTSGQLHGPRSIMIDPTIAAGRPVMTGTTLSTAQVFAHYRQGRTMDELAVLFECDRTLIEDAILCELLWLSQHS